MRTWKRSIRLELWWVANIGKDKSPIHDTHRPERVVTVRDRAGRFAGPSASFKSL